MMLNHRATPFSPPPPPPPACLPPTRPPRPSFPQFSYTSQLLHPPPPPPSQFSYSCRYLRPLPFSRPQPPPPFPISHSSAPLPCTSRVPFLSTYVAPAPAPAPSPQPPPSFKYLPVAESETSAGHEKTVVATSRHPPRPWLRRGGRKRLVWVPRSNNDGSSGEKYASTSQSLEFELSSLEADQRTSVMIKNIPNKLSRDMLIALLDEHCIIENQKAPSYGSPASEYDFIYLPVDFKSSCNLGYAFVNFTTAAAATRLHAALHGRKWAIFGSHKVSHVCYARLQGKEAFTSHFKYSYFRCDADEFLPAIFDPPRNGSTFCTTPTTIGGRADPIHFWW